ncbi:hypothetical protein TNCV_2617441 [Trichonephila clavipes]|nr:hypothetical protein TNCV_2617441 [Trichonephila clavipes]
MFSSIDRVTAEIRERFKQLQNLAQKYAFLKPEVILSMDELNLDQAPQDINKEEFQLEYACLQAFVAATHLSCKKELIGFGSLGLLKYIIESKLEDRLPNIVIMLRIFLTSAISNASCEKSFCLGGVIDGPAKMTGRQSSPNPPSYSFQCTFLIVHQELD